MSVVIEHRTGHWFIGRGRDTQLSLMRERADAIEFPTRDAAQAVLDTIDNFRGAYHLLGEDDDHAATSVPFYGPTDVV